MDAKLQTELEQASNENFKKQLDPEESSYECFFHYTDEKLFQAGFEQGFKYYQEQLDKLFQENH